jgi:hypothetical protein
MIRLENLRRWRGVGADLDVRQGHQLFRSFASLAGSVQSPVPELTLAPFGCASLSRYGKVARRQPCWSGNDE